MLKKLLYIFCISTIFSCVDPYSVEIAEGEQLLTIEGLVTSGPGPHIIKLTRSDTYGSIFEGLVRPVRNATVTVRDDQGEVTFFEEDSNARGNYFSPADFRAIVGRSYTLQIETIDGNKYTSLPEQVNPVPEIKELTYQVVRIPVEGEINDESGVQLIVEIDDPVEESNFYFWRNSESVHVLETRPDLFTPRPSDANPSREPQPKDCCITCFRSELVGNQNIFIANDDNFNGLTTRIPAGFIPDDGLRFVNTFRVDLRQISISPEAYRFLRLVKQQTEISGSVFDPPPANIRGNMISLDNPDEVVLGYFMAAGETGKRIYIKNSDLDFVQDRAIIPDDCREVEGATLDPPADWNPND